MNLPGSFLTPPCFFKLTDLMSQFQLLQLGLQFRYADYEWPDTSGHSTAWYLFAPSHVLSVTRFGRVVNPINKKKNLEVFFYPYRGGRIMYQRGGGDF